MHPVLFMAFGEPVHAWASAVTLCYILGAAIGVWLGVRDGRTLDDMLELGVVIVTSAILGSKLFHVIFEATGHRLRDGALARGPLDLLRDDPWHWARLFEPGYVFYGGLLGAIVAGLFFCWRRRVPQLGAVGDYAVPGIALGTFIGRIGCFLAGCCHGAPTLAPWAVVFPAGHPSRGLPVHPVQLYDAAFGLIALVAAARLYPRRRFGGELLLGYLASYAMFRFVTEMFRADADRGLWLQGSLSTSQAVAVATLPVALVLWHRGLRLARAGRMRRPQRISGTPAAPAAPAAPTEGTRP